MSDVVWGASGGSAPAPVAGLRLPQLVKEVVLGDFIGAGCSGGKVYKATWRGCVVAVKLMISSDPDHLRGSTREALLSRSLSHPHLVQTYAIHVSQMLAEDLDPTTYVPRPRQRTPHQAAAGGDDQGICSAQVNALLASGLLSTMDEEQSRRFGSSGGGSIWLMGTTEAGVGGGSAAAGAGASAGAARVGTSAGISASPSPLTASPLPLTLALPSAAASGTASGTASPIVASGRTTAGRVAQRELSPAPSPMPRPGRKLSSMPSSLLPLLPEGSLHRGAEPSFGAQRPSDSALLVPAGHQCISPPRRAAGSPDAHAAPSSREPSLPLPPSPPQQRPLDAVERAAAEMGPPVPIDVTDVTAVAELTDSPVPARDTSPSGWTAPGGSAAAAAADKADDHDTVSSTAASPRTRLGSSESRLLDSLSGPVTAVETAASAPAQPQAPAQAPSVPRRLGAPRRTRSSAQPPSAVQPQALSRLRPGTVPPLPPCPVPPTEVAGACASPASAAVAAAATNPNLSVSSMPAGGASFQRPDKNASRFLNALLGMGAAPGKHLVVVVMEHCERGTLLQLLQDQAAALDLPEPEPAAGYGSNGASGTFLFLPRRRRRQQALLRSLSMGNAKSGQPALAWAGVLGKGSAAAGGGDGGVAPAPAVGSEAEIDDGGCDRGLEMLRNALEIAQALAYLHSLDLVHGDLKPGNVLLRAQADTAQADLQAGGNFSAAGAGAAGGVPAAGSSSGSRRCLAARGYCCKVADFGLTNPVAAAGSLPRATNGSGWGALPYLAPEVVIDGRYGKPSDVYSYGALLWHMVTGHAPHSTLHPAQVLVGLASGELALEMPVGAEPTVRKIGAACLVREPERRPTFEHIVAALIKAVRRTPAARSRQVGGGGGVAAGSSVRRCGSGNVAAALASGSSGVGAALGATRLGGGGSSGHIGAALAARGGGSGNTAAAAAAPARGLGSGGNADAPAAITGAAGSGKA